MADVRRFADLRTREAWIVLGTAMGIAAAALLWLGADTSFSIDESHYYARLVGHGDRLEPYHDLTLGYLFAPHNGHLQILGRFIYEALFAVFGAAYLPFRIVAVLAVLLCVGLTFELLRRRIGNAAALIPCLLLLCLGAAWEVLLWPFDMHTALALAGGLGALLALEIGGRHADRAACLLLIASIASIELGLAFVAGVAVLVMAGPEPRRRAWVFAVPLVAYAAWWIWARHFDQAGQLDLVNVGHILDSWFGSLAATLASLFGLVPSGTGVAVYFVGTAGTGAVLAVGAVVGASVVLVRRGATPAAVAIAVILLAYWTLIALGDRPPDASRYMFAAVVLLLLFVAELARGARVPAWGIAILLAVGLLAAGGNLSKLSDGRNYLVKYADISRAEYAMLELGSGDIPSFYGPSRDRAIKALDAEAPGEILDAGTYAEWSERRGSLAFSIDELRDQSPEIRRIADVTLIDGLGVELERADPPSNSASCTRLRASAGSLGVATDLGSESTAVKPLGDEPVSVSLGRFQTEGSSAELGDLEPGRWAVIRTPADAAPDPWRLYAGGSVIVCAEGAG